MIRNATPLPWRARGLSDSLDGSTSFNGAMANLQNLIPDPTTSQLWECRPAAVPLYTFATLERAFSNGFSNGFAVLVNATQGVISALKVIGNTAYGMIGYTDGLDHPFAINLLTGTPITIGGTQTAATLPVSQSVTGPWTPPIMDLIGSKLIVTHIGFQTLLPTIAFGYIDISNPASPTWNASNLTGFSFTAVPPTGVAQFFNRAYYIYNLPAQPALVASDILNPLNVTTVSGAGTQILTLGDSAPLSALGQLRFYNQLGGIIQGLVVFKGAANTYQITGDFALSTLAINSMNFATGTLSPLSVVSTPRGLGFMSPEGFRIIDFQSNISDPVGLDGQGTIAPFVYTAQPTRICAACNGNIIRLTTQNTQAVGTPTQEYWYDLGRQIWHGPHTFPATVIAPWMGTFVMGAVNGPASLWQSDPVQKATSTYVENGVQLSWTYKTVFLPDTDQMANVQISQSLLDIQLTAGAPPITITSSDQNGIVIDTIPISVVGQPSIWGHFQWGQAVWGAPATALAPRILAWHMPLVFTKAQFTANGISDGGVRVGAWHFRYKVLRYLADITAAA